jgi:HK97 family phage portal protein
VKIFGLTIPFTGSKSLASVDTSRGGWFRVLESFAGAWQQNVTVDYTAVLSNHADFACKTLIASDIAKLRIKLVAQVNGVWQETTNPAYSPVLRKPNHFQTRIQFIESWVTSKLQRGNTYVLKERDNRNVVTALYVLDPCRVRPLIADNGDVFYELQDDRLSGLEGRIVVPAREIIHDRFNCMFHPLVGISPIFAAGLAATQGLAIQQQATRFFQNSARPGGLLIAPGSISDETASRLKTYWDDNFSGEKAGKVAVLGDGLKYEALSATAEDSQLIEQLKWSAEVVCSVYHVPPFKVGVGPIPPYANVQAANVDYYSRALQILIESIEALLDDGLGMDGVSIGTEIDVDGLLRMDSVALMEMLDKASGVLTIDEKRAYLSRPPTEGGNAVYLQQQNFSLAALAKRDAKEDPFATSSKQDAPPALPKPEPEKAFDPDLLAKAVEEALAA